MRCLRHRINRLPNTRIVPQQQNHRPAPMNQLNHPMYSIHNQLDKQSKSSIVVESATGNIPNNNVDNQFELSMKQSTCPSDELHQLKCQLAEKESKLTDVQLEALASAHQLNQMKDELTRLYAQLNYFRTDNERLQLLVTHLQQHQQQQHLQLQCTATTCTTVTNTTTTTNPMVISSSTRCNSLPKTILSMNFTQNSIGLRNNNDDEDKNDPMSILCNTDRIPNECIPGSSLFIGFSEIKTDLKNSLIATVNLILTNTETNQNHHVHSSTKSTLNIGTLCLSKLTSWNSITNSLINLYNLYSTYLYSNQSNDLETNELKQYHLYIDTLDCTWKFEFNKNPPPPPPNHSIQFNQQTIENPQNLIDLLQSHSKQSIVQLSIEHCTLNNNEQADLLTDSVHQQPQNQCDLSNIFKNLNNLIIRTSLHREILYFYLELLSIYHFLIFYDTEELYLNTIIDAFHDHLNSSLNSSSLKVYHFNLSNDNNNNNNNDDPASSINQFSECLSQSINLLKQQNDMIIIFYVQSMHQMSNDEFFKIMNYFKLNDHENNNNNNNNDKNSTRLSSIYLIGTWITSTNLITTMMELMNEQTLTSSSSSVSFSPVPRPLQNLTTTTTPTAIKCISYPNKRDVVYKPVQCTNELVCWIEIEYSIKRLHMLCNLKTQLIDSTVTALKRQLSSNSSTDYEKYFNEFDQRLEFFENLIKWIDQVLNYLNQFLIDLLNHHYCKPEETTNDTLINNEQQHQLVQHLNNPLKFLNLPFNNPTSAELWFINLWNNEIVQLIKKYFISHPFMMKQNNLNYNITDPTDWILSTWPWHHSLTNEMKCPHEQTNQSSSPSLIHLKELLL
ncbi:unnamed protein product [Schistosoma turkestanicum]|nr:unnamed protein product [Schistosoma turkestanicum]